MLQAAADVLMQFRLRTVKTLEGLTQAQWFTQPEGFANNIAWNVGHLCIAQQNHCYRRLGVSAPLSLAEMDAMQAIYGGGTSTADWDIQPDTDELMRLFIELPGMLSADIEAGKFGNYVVPEPIPGKLPPAKSELHSFIFNQFHEGLHIGTIGDLLGFLK